MGVRERPMAIRLADLSGSLSSPVEKRLFVEYGAIFATTATPPPVITFADESHVETFQSSLSLSRGVFGDHEIRLQTIALAALTRAAAEMAARGKTISARAADAGGRSYLDTVKLWTRNVTRGLEHWESLGRISREQTKTIAQLSPVDQIEVILNLEDTEELFFGTFFDRSILHSVAAPGASQHLSMLAFDVAEYEEFETEEILGENGWYRTVPNDLPHFTYLGHNEALLPDLGLRRVERISGERMYAFWTPDLDRFLDTAGRE